MSGPASNPVALLMAATIAVTSLIAADLDTETKPPLKELVPAEKHLDPAWVKSLSERGEPQVVRGVELKYIGMPVGGLFAGQIYLGGDGRLWNWDIFNDKVFTGAEHYARPMEPSKFLPLEQGFTLKIGDRTIPLDAKGFADVSFRGEYPVGTVHYGDPDVPVSVTLEAFSPFIPLDVEDSSLPATILRYTLTNTSASPVELTLTGSLENAVGLRHRNAHGERSVRIVRDKGLTFLECSAKGSPGELISATSATNAPKMPYEQLEDAGTMGLALLGDPADLASDARTIPLDQKLAGLVGRRLNLNPGHSATVTFAVTWFFPNLNHLPKLREQGRWYSGIFDSALGVARYVASNQQRLVDDTLLWRKTWYDSTLPYWFLDRTMIPTDNLATSSNYRLKNGRWWAWEGVGDCAGTCGHVYGYAQALARLFPVIEREQREKVDFGTSLRPDGSIVFRGENGTHPAIDAQAFYILRVLRDHQMTPDNAFLAGIWPRVKSATDWLIAKDGSESGMIHGNQHNTLDSDWFGENAWLSGLYQSALLASADMADVMKDTDYAARCRMIAAKGADYQAKNLFNGKYYQNKVDPAHLDAINSGSGCEIDQLLGQSWAFQVGLPRVFPTEETVKSLESLWTYNFAPDVGPYRKANKPGRWYAMPGESGFLMCTFPRDDWNYQKAAGKGNPGFVGYFNECMNGFEHQLAGHMIWEGEPDGELVTKGMAVERAIHDRYAPSKRNPYNEIECGDHYGRSMASYGVFLAVCGFEYDGPRGHIGFAPRIHPADFRAAFTAAEGWGTFSQQIHDTTMTATLWVRWGNVKLRSVSLACRKAPKGVAVTLDGKEIPSEISWDQGKVTIRFARPETIPTGGRMTLSLTCAN